MEDVEMKIFYNIITSKIFQKMPEQKILKFEGPWVEDGPAGLPLNCDNQCDGVWVTRCQGCGGSLCMDCRLMQVYRELIIVENRRSGKVHLCRCRCYCLEMAVDNIKWAPTTRFRSDPLPSMPPVTRHEEEEDEEASSINDGYDSVS